MAASVSELFTGAQITTAVAAVRLVAALAAGAVIGLEREMHAKPAGFRTYIIICLGAALLMMLSIHIPQQFAGGDPGRIAAQVVTGIGFLGAGAIFRLGLTVRGLTTAAAIWTTAAIGLAFGAGMFGIGGLAVGLLLLTLTVFEAIEQRFVRTGPSRALLIVTDRVPGQVRRIAEVLNYYGVPSERLSISEQLDEKQIQIRAVARLEKGTDVREFFDRIEAIEGIHRVEIE
jgi:putative Mg2+ transporter-C (MgtC) family protein